MTYNIAGKFGGELNLAVWRTAWTIAKLKSAKISFFVYICMAILYQTAKFKSTNMFVMVIWDPAAKFNSRQYFRLYSNSWMTDYYSIYYYSYIFDFFERAGLTPATCVTLMEQCSKAISFLTTTGKSLHKNGNNIQKMLDAVKVYVP